MIDIPDKSKEECKNIIEQAQKEGRIVDESQIIRCDPKKGYNSPNKNK